MLRARSLLLSAVLTALVGAVSAQAQIYRGGNDTQIRSLLQRLETKTDAFRNAVDRRSVNPNRNNQNLGSITDLVAEFENATDALRNSFNGRRSTVDEATEVMNRAWYIDNFIQQDRPGAAIQRQWSSIRTDLDQLARYYAVSWNWNRPAPPRNQDRWGNNDQNTGWGRGRFDNRITGTYRLNTSMSDDATAAINRALGNNVNDRQRQNLERRLSSPQDLAIEVNGDSVRLATNLAQPVSFTINGVATTETNARGRTTRTTVTRSGNMLTVNTEGDRSNDFWVSFEPVGRDQLRMTRRIYLEGRNEMVTVSSTYDRVSTAANWPPVDRRPDWNNGSAGTGTFYIPNGTRLTAVLRDRIASNISQVGDRFTMEVTSPARYRGALITGRVVEARSSGRVTGRANIGLDFESINVNGRTYDFAGIIDSARETDGDVINVSNEGSVRDSNQTTRTVTRAGIGAVLGAVIGAIAGGGEGAAIGAGIGAGAGAGSVILQGRDNIDLQSGSEFSITASAPANVVGQGWRN